MTPDPLARLESHLAILETLSFGDDAAGDTTITAPPAFSPHALAPHELERAQALLVRVERAEERIRGMQTRVRGELAALRRPRREGRSPRAPRALDTSV